MAADGGDNRRLIDGADPAWSPDGRRIAYEKVSELTTEVWVADPSGDSPQRLARGSSPVWSPEGDRIAYVGNSVMVMEADGSSGRPVTGDFGWALAWSPDGRHLAYSTTCDDRSEVWVVDMVSSGSWLLAEGAFPSGLVAGIGGRNRTLPGRAGGCVGTVADLPVGLHHAVARSRAHALATSIRCSTYPWVCPTYTDR